MGHDGADAAKALAALLESEGLDSEELMSWAKARTAELLAEGPGEGDVQGLLEDLPKVGGYSPERREESKDRELLGEEGGGFEGLNTGNFAAVDEHSEVEGEFEDNADDSMELSALQTGEYEIVDAEVADDEGEAAQGEAAQGAPEELEALQSGEYEMVDADELEELDDDDFVEMQSGEYEIVSEDEDEDEAAQDAAPAPPAESSAGAPEPVDESDDLSVDIDLDLDLDF